MLASAWLFSLASRAAVTSITLIASVALFLTLVALHRRVREREQHARKLRDLNREGASRVRREWPDLRQPRETVPENHPFASDLDVAGTTVSLYRLLDVASSATGRPMLLRWLLGPSPTVEVVRERQTAVQELAAAVAFREELALAARASELGPEQFVAFLDWAEEAPWLLDQRLVLWAARIIPIATLVTAVLALYGRLPRTAPGLSIIAGLLILARYRSTMNAQLARVLGRVTGLRAQQRMLDELAKSTWNAPLLRHERERAAGGAVALRSLDRWLSLLEGQGSLMHAILAVVVLWDIHALARLDRWRRQHGARLRESLSALGNVEALAALGTLAHDNPGWSFPVIDRRADRVTATGLGHPLLPSTTRVANDVVLGPPGTLLLVTGSNMSGKSTLLRAIGLNVVLAQAGAPVCASSLTMPGVELRTSIRLADSLGRGVSLFMAELERLKEIVDAARRPDRSEPLLYLLDEILHGTNTAERLIAARAVLIHLVHAGAIGAVTTHDLTLAADGALASASRPVHFTEGVSDNGHGAVAMTFDYRLRPGLATSTNALKLLALVGLSAADS